MVAGGIAVGVTYIEVTYIERLNTVERVSLTDQIGLLETRLNM